MNHKAVRTCAALVSGLVLAGCSSDTGARTPAAPATTPSASAATPSGGSPTASGSPSTAPEPPAPEEPAPEQPAPEQPAPADPLTAFRSSPGGAPYAGIVTRVERRDAQSGGVVHRVTADVNDRAVATEVCQAYRSEMQTGPERVEVVDTVDELLAFTPGGPEPCTVQPPSDVGAVPFPAKFSYEEALAAWRSGMPYYDAFCLNYDPVTEAGVSQCRGIEAGTVDAVTGEYIGG